MSQDTRSPVTGDLAGLAPHRRDVPTAAGTLSCIDVGSGPAALFVHGVGTNAYLWRHVIAALAPDRRVVAVDLPGHGSSPIGATGLRAAADAIALLCDELGLSELDLVGNDTGGAICQVLAAHHPERLRTFTLTNCDTKDNIPPLVFKPTVYMARLGLFARMAPRLMKNPRRAARSAFGLTYENVDAVPEEVVVAFLEPVAGTRERAQAFQRWLGALRPDDLEEAEPMLRRLDVPTRMVWGTGDRFFRLKHAYGLAELIPGTTGVDEVPGGRLFFVDERADELVAHLREHWRMVTR